jgi:Chalcone isomerase-like
MRHREACENFTLHQQGVVRTASAINGLLLALTISVAQGKECKGVNFPDHVEVGGSNLTLNGLGLQRATFLKVDVYVAALYVTATSSDPNSLINSDGPQELIVHFLRGVGVEDLRKEWSRDFTHVVPDRPISLMKRVETLNSWLSDVKRDERLTFIRQPGEGIQVIVNGVIKGTIPGDDFSRDFTSIWVGAAPPSPELKKGLLGGKCD